MGRLLVELPELGYWDTRTAMHAEKFGKLQEMRLHPEQRRGGAVVLEPTSMAFFIACLAILCDVPGNWIFLQRHMARPPKCFYTPPCGMVAIPDIASVDGSESPAGDPQSHNEKPSTDVMSRGPARTLGLLQVGDRLQWRS